MDVKDRVKKGELVKLQKKFIDDPAEKLVLTPSTFPNGVYVCAIENLSKPCLPKLSALVADKLEQKGIVRAAEQSKASATLYFETWFDSYSSYQSIEMVLSGNPTFMGTDFAAKIEQSLAAGNEPDVHKHFRFGLDPISLAMNNANDKDKFVYVALTAVDMKDAIGYPGIGEKHLGASKNVWVQPGSIPSSRTLIGKYEGDIATEKAVKPMLVDAIDLLADRVAQSPLKN
jgi:hypothetical protein